MANEEKLPSLLYSLRGVISLQGFHTGGSLGMWWRGGVFFEKTNLEPNGKTLFLFQIITQLE